MPVFDCSVAEGDPTGRVMPKGFPEPAQKQVIQKVIDEKLAAIRSGNAFKPITLWTPSGEDHPLAGRTFIMDGQHRFVAACIEGSKIEVTYKLNGIPGFRDGWVLTEYADIKPAKEVLQEQLAKTQAKWA